MLAVPAGRPVRPRDQPFWCWCQWNILRVVVDRPVVDTAAHVSAWRGHEVAAAGSDIDAGAERRSRHSLGGDIRHHDAGRA